MTPPRRWPRRGPTSTTPSRTSAVRRSSCTGASGSPGSTTCISSRAGPRSTRCSTATARGTASSWSDCPRAARRRASRPASQRRRVLDVDVIVPAIPDSYDEYRDALRSFIATHRPDLEWKQRWGLRVPDRAEDVEALRAYARALYDGGYVAARFRTERSDPFEQRILDQELAAAGIPAVPGNPLVAGALKHFGTDEQRAVFFPPMARGDHIWTQLFSEPDAGSDLTGLQTRGTLDGNDYVIVGQKVWSTWAQWADYGYLLARTEPVDGAGGITAFILDMRSPGVDVRPLREMTGTTDFNEVFFDEVRIPATNVIGAPGEGWRVAGASLAEERSGVGGAGGGLD